MERVIRFYFWKIFILLGICWGGVLPPAWGAEPVIIWAGPPTAKAVALTFDDGPSPVYTPQILALLKRYDARGTFFVVGHRVEENPGFVRAELKDGNEVGNHSFSHPRMPKENQACRERELERTAVVLDLEGCPKTSRLFRPPYSAWDERLKSYLAHTRRSLALWSLDSGDWQGLAAPVIVKNVLDRVKNGSIIIFHDGDEQGQANRQPTVEALKTILPALQARGYRMVTVSELIGCKDSPKGPKRQNN